MESQQGGEPIHWLTLRQAAHILGVNESTLRHWANQGKLRTFRTPGGHRRFAEEDLRGLISQATAPAAKGTAVFSRVALNRIRRRLGRGQVTASPWDRAFNNQGRERMREEGRRLLGVLSDYLSHGRGRQVPAEALVIGHHYAQEFLNDGISLKSALEGFLFFRDSLENTAASLAKDEEASPERQVEIWQRLGRFMDQVLLAIVEAYESASTTAAGDAAVAPVTRYL